MYAIKVNKPFVVEEKDVEKFFENSKEQEGIAEELASVFGSEWFDFKPDENGMMRVSIDVETEN
ncbi:MAG: hypothetical protein IKS03_06985 [Ruminococcus sp.]|nr:hypothetical protein [Ruminococcus sp.]